LRVVTPVVPLVPKDDSSPAAPYRAVGQRPSGVAPRRPYELLSAVVHVNAPLSDPAAGVGSPVPAAATA
jgi:hypothetical protein